MPSADADMPQQPSRAVALVRYVIACFGWLVLSWLWVALVGPYADPRCHTSASFGFLPAAIVVPFLLLLLYLVTVGVHAGFAFRRKRLDARRRDGVPPFGADAWFFVPFAAVALLGLTSVMQWDRSVHCLVMAFVIAAPYIVTPLINPRLLAWSG